VAAIVRDATTTQMVQNIADIEARAHVSSGPSSAANMTSTALGARLASLARTPNLPPQDQASIAMMRTQIPQLAAVEQRAAEAKGAASTAGQQQAAETLLSGGPEARQALLTQYQGFARVRTELAALHSLSPWGAGEFLARAHPSQLSIV